MVEQSRHVPEPPLWELRDVSKAFPGVLALDAVSLELRTGEIHALVGENGSGKSTLVKCLAGVHEPDTGALRHRGDPVRVRDPQVARSYGVATFHQEFSLITSLSVAENICLGRMPSRRRIIDWEAAQRRARESLEVLNVHIDPQVPVSSLSVAEQQFVEIAKAISQDMSLLILDEPTAALGPYEVERLHEVIQRIAQQGRAILYISHRLDEVMEIVDRVSVLKDGRLVESEPASDLTVAGVARLMVGENFEEHYPDRPVVEPSVRVEVRDVSTEAGLRDVTFSISRGEVLGLGGVAGAGRTAVARALFGVDRITAGRVLIDGEPVAIGSPADAIDAGVALVPEDRKAHGLFFNFAGPQNMTIADLAKLRTGPFLRLGLERSSARDLVGRLRIGGRTMDSSVRFLSGGNQQKVVLARWLFTTVRLLILDEPTHGIDVSAKVEVYHLINDLSEAGLAILLISSDFPELLAMSDRVAVVRHGRIVHEAGRGELSEHELVEIAAGGVMVE